MTDARNVRIDALLYQSQLLALVDTRPPPSEKDIKLVQKLGQLEAFLAVFPQERMGQPVSFGPT
jgi:hypothetical protein